MFSVYFFHIFSDSCQTNYLNIYQTDLHEICSDGRTLAVDERSAVSFFMPQGTLSWQTIFVDCIFCHARSPKRLAPLAPLFLGFSPTSPIALPQFVLDVTAPHPSHAPQGSVLGPLLFMAYIFPIAGIAHIHNIDKQQYADVTQLFISLSPSDYMPDLDSLVTPLTPCIFGSVQMAWP